MTPRRPPRRRGRPRGPTFPNDLVVLREIADAKVRNPSSSVRMAIRESGVDGDSNTRRIERHFKSMNAELMNAARDKAAAATLTDHIGTPRSRVAPISLKHAEIAQCLGASARYIELAKLAAEPPPWFKTMSAIADRQSALLAAANQIGAHAKLQQATNEKWLEFNKIARWSSELVNSHRTTIDAVSRMQRQLSLNPWNDKS